MWLELALPTTFDLEQSRVVERKKVCVMKEEEKTSI
jgi:hypothetical protein